MSLADDWQMLSALPYLAAAGGIVYISVVAVGSKALSIRRRQKHREREQQRQIQGVAPWDDWLREINEKQTRAKIND